VNWVVPFPRSFLSLGLTVMATPLLGFEEATVNVYVEDDSSSSAKAAGITKAHIMAMTLSSTTTFFIIFPSKGFVLIQHQLGAISFRPISRRRTTPVKPPSFTLIWICDHALSFQRAGELTNKKAGCLHID
jgi:hypothetical protein